MNLIAGAPRRCCQTVEYLGREHIAPDHAERRGGRLGSRLFNNIAQPEASLLRCFPGRHHAVFPRVGPRHILRRDHAVPGFFILSDQLPGHAALAVINQIIGQQHGKRRVADHGSGAQHGMAQPQRLGLPDIDATDLGRHDIPDHGQLLCLALFGQLGLQFIGLVEVIGDRALGAARDEHQLRDAGGHRLLGRVLNQRFIDDRQHLLGIGLGGRQKARALPGHGKHGLADLVHRRPASAPASLSGITFA